MIFCFYLLLLNDYSLYRCGNSGMPDATNQQPPTTTLYDVIVAMLSTLIVGLSYASGANNGAHCPWLNAAPRRIALDCNRSS